MKPGDFIQKVLFVSYVPSFIASKGDAVNERQLIFSVCDRLVKKNGKCIVITNINAEDIEKNRIHIKNVYMTKPQNSSLIVLPLISFQPFKAILRALLSLILALYFSIIVKIFKYKIYIYIRESENAFGFLIFPWLSSKTIVKIPFLAEEEYQVPSMMSGLSKAIFMSLDMFAMKYAYAIAVNSEFFLKTLISKRGIVPQGKILFLPPGVDYKKISKVKSWKEEYSTKKSKNIYLIGFVGSLSKYQGIDVLADSLALLKRFQLKKPFVILIIGDGPERKKIEKVCKEENLNCKITGFVSHEVALKYLSLLDALIVPRVVSDITETTIPIKIIEAWALGIPVITTRHKVFDSLKLRDGEDIIFSEPIPESVAQKIFYTLENKEIRRKLSSNGPSLAKKFYYSILAQKLLDIYSKEEL